MNKLLASALIFVYFYGVAHAQEFVPIPVESDAAINAEAAGNGNYEFKVGLLLKRKTTIAFNNNQGDEQVTTKECVNSTHPKICIWLIKQLGIEEKTLQAADRQYPGIFDHTSANADSIPPYCGLAGNDERSQIPAVLQLNDNSAKIVKITNLMEKEPKTMQFPAVNGAPARYFLLCPVKVEWSNGVTDYAYFEEFDDQHSNVQVYYGKEQYIPPYQ